MGGVKLTGCNHFVRSNPRSDLFHTYDFHHVEILTGDAKAAANHFQNALGMNKRATSSLLTKNNAYTSIVLASSKLKFVFTAPNKVRNQQQNTQNSLTQPGGEEWNPAECPNPAWSPEEMTTFFEKHGQSPCAVGVHVADAAAAYEAAVSRGAVPRAGPRTHSECTTAEVQLYGDVVLRFVSGRAIDDDSLPFLPGYEAVNDASVQGRETFGIERIDHVVGNVPELIPAIEYAMNATGFHEFAEFTAEDVGTIDSGLNSMVLASNNEKVLLPMNEPTFGSKRKSQILTYLEQHGGAGVQHIALKTSDIFTTVRAMRDTRGGLEFMERPRDSYFLDLPQKVGDILTAEQIAQCAELGILADKDDQGTLLQIFTKPIGDRSTLFFEIIQRVGCTHDEATGAPLAEQLPGCGGFGKGNFHELFRAIEEYETKSGINKIE